MTDKVSNQSVVVVCNFQQENTIELDLAGECILSNYGRNTISGTYKPYECAVFRV
jgi:hypothetical protein